MYDKLASAVKYIQTVKKTVPKIGIVLGSGLGTFTDHIQDKVEILYDDIPYFKQTSIKGHDGQLILGKIEGIPLAVLSGRVHAYEGHTLEEVVFPVRTLATLGVEILILTNAAGGINLSYQPGDLVIIEDHINLTGRNPLVGSNIAELGPRFPDMTEAYNHEINNILMKTASDINHPLKKGVYCALLGPTYETPAEIRMLKTIGSDMVGMSTVPESLAANHLGLKVGAISCITNMAAGISKSKLSHDEVKKEANKAMDVFSKLLLKAIPQIAKSKL